MVFVRLIRLISLPEVITRHYSTLLRHFVVMEQPLSELTRINCG